ncbi:MAG: magnesium/cobalt transporter CorA [Planctomycetaceae bacterium]|nr:magnesium/cobalt transporter CorA [Planctomycetaceae bacterium]
MSRRSRRWQHKRGSVRRPGAMGQAPGTFSVDPNAPQPVITVIAYGPDQHSELPVKSVDDIAGLLGKTPVTWINVDGLGNAAVIQQLGRIFHLHPLALEDVVNTHQRSKCDDYGDVLFCVARMVQGPPLVSEQISFFVGPTWLLTFQEDVQGDSLEPVRERLRQHRGRIRQAGPDYLLYELIDAIIEGYFPLLEKYGDVLDELDREAPYPQIGRKLSEIHHLRSDLLYLRRVIWPHRDALQSLLRGGHKQISSDTLLYLRDCYDHVAQLIDVLEIYRENCTDLRDFFYSKLSNRTNEIMRMLTIISTLFLPMTFIAGVYGMNFDFMPELHWRLGYPLSLVLMAAVGIGFTTFFWRRGWLRSSEPHQTAEDATAASDAGE